MIENIEIHKILTDNNRFSLKDVLFMPEEHSCDGLFDKLGILNPVIVQRDAENFQLIDGFKRVRFAKRKEMDVIDAVVLPEDTPVTDIITLLLCGKGNEIGASMINRVQFVFLALTLGASEKWISETLCAQLGLNPQAGALRSFERINEMPEGLRAFCHDKKFSFKQILNLTSYPDDLLNLLAEWCSVLQLTASTMEEIASNLRGWLRANNKSAGDIMADPEIREIIDSAMGARDKTEKLRGLLRARLFPVLTDANSKMKNIVSYLRLPKEISIEWDRTLENKNLGIKININDPRKWEEMIRKMGSEEMRAAVKEMLDELL